MKNGRAEKERAEHKNDAALKLTLEHNGNEPKLSTSDDQN